MKKKYKLSPKILSKKIADRECEIALRSIDKVIRSLSPKQIKIIQEMLNKTKEN